MISKTPSMKKNSFRVKTQPSVSQLLMEKNRNHRHDIALYNITRFHLKPLEENPELYSKATVHIDKIKQKPGQGSKDNTKSKNKLMVVPQSINIRQSLTKISGLNIEVEKLLEEDTVMLVTAKKWLIFDMETNLPLKGYKFKKEHDVASLTKILTFYTAYMIIQQYYLTIDKLDLLVDEQDESTTGTRIKLKADNLVTLEDMLYAMMLNSANNAATCLATNLGSLVQKKREGKYFSCFDIPNENKQHNMEIFLKLMNAYAKQLGMESSKFVNVHGMCKNKSTAKDIALLTSQCYKIPLFCKVVKTKYHSMKIKYIGDNGELQFKQLKLQNTNNLLWENSRCIGGKTGCNYTGGESLVACYEGNIVIVVLGSVGRDEKFADSEKLMRWLCKKLSN